MKFFAITILGIIITGALFILGSMMNWPFLIITMCPSALVILWLNGFAASNSGVRITIVDDVEPDKAASNTTRQKKPRVLEYK